MAARTFSELFELALVLVRLDYVPGGIVTLLVVGQGRERLLTRIAAMTGSVSLSAIRACCEWV